MGDHRISGFGLGPNENLLPSSQKDKKVVAESLLIPDRIFVDSGARVSVWGMFDSRTKLGTMWALLFTKNMKTRFGPKIDIAYGSLPGNHAIELGAGMAMASRLGKMEIESAIKGGYAFLVSGRERRMPLANRWFVEGEVGISYRYNPCASIGGFQSVQVGKHQGLGWAAITTGFKIQFHIW